MTPTAAALVAASAPDPNAAIEVWRRADAGFMGWADGDIPDELGDRHSDAYALVLRTRPTTAAGLIALIGWARERMDWLHPNGSYAEPELCIAIDDAAKALIGKMA